jgi:drug/metabolite transporter (DMT)-like permease
MVTPRTPLIDAVAPLPSRVTLLAFAAFVVLTGGAAVAIRFTYGELAPFWGAATRFLLAALVFWAVVAARRISLPRGRALAGAFAFGVIGIGLAFLFLYWGLVTTPASLSQTISAVVPLLTLFLAAAQRLERLHVRGIVGASLTVVGIAIAVGAATDPLAEWPRLVAIVAGAACLAQAGIIAKRFPATDPFALYAVAMTAGGTILFAGSWLASEPWIVPSEMGTWLAFGYIVVFVTVVAFLLYLYVLRRWTATGASYGMVLVPLVTIVLASTLAGERITPPFLVGALIVLSGVYLGALHRPGRLSWLRIGARRPKKP